MREIKFRVWCGLLGRYVAVLELYPNKNKLDLPEDSNFVYQQFTGLKDKTGREIYDGDIVKYNNLNYEVSWGDSEWKALCPHYHKYHWPSITPFRYIRSGEIVGNIFENPELLKQ